MSIPCFMQAIGIHGPGQASVVSRPVPKLRPGYMLVKTVAVALNPTDWKAIEQRASPGITSGCDYAGIVMAIGPQPHPSRNFRVGDRVAGYIVGCNAYEPENGAFAEYCVGKVGLALRIPDSMSFEQASTLGVGVTCVGQGLFKGQGLPIPKLQSQINDLSEIRVLIYGGSTASGAIAIQCAKLAGFTVITTCSPPHFDYAKSLGADAVFDYKLSDIGAQINAHTKNTLLHAFDCISTSSSAAICYAALSTAPPSGERPKYNALMPVEKLPRDDVDYDVTATSTSPGEPVRMFGKEYLKPDDYDFCTMWWSVIESLLAQGRLKVHTVEVRSGGLSGVLQGLDDLKANRVSGIKLVYPLEADDKRSEQN